jgi:hypothetical protein
MRSLKKQLEHKEWSLKIRKELSRVCMVNNTATSLGISSQVEIVADSQTDAQISFNYASNYDISKLNSRRKCCTEKAIRAKIIKSRGASGVITHP